MQLSYRGSSYEAHPATVEGTDTQQTGLFLGREYKIRNFNVTQRYAPSTQLKYRGVDYIA